MMQTLKIHMYKPGKTEADSKVTIPLSVLQISEKILPLRLKEALAKEGIVLTELGGLFAKQGPKGTLIEIENPNEKLVIIVE